MSDQKTTRYCFDTEFIEDGKTIDLVSIGIVAEDGREFYAVSSGFSVSKLHANPWLVENVRPYLPQRTHPTGPQCRCITGWHLDLDHPAVRSRAQIARAVTDFLLADGKPELWAWYAAYDHVALCQLFGRSTHQLGRAGGRVGGPLPARPRRAAPRVLRLLGPWLPPRRGGPMTTLDITDVQRTRNALDEIADLLDVPASADEPTGELAERCVPALRQLGVDLEAAEAAVLADGCAVLDPGNAEQMQRLYAELVLASGVMGPARVAEAVRAVAEAQRG